MADFDSTNPTDWGAAEIARRIARREVSAGQVVGAHVARIEEVDGRLNAVIMPRLDEAVAEAQAADERQARGEPLGPLHGVPITVKACFATAGQTATVGNTPGHLSDKDALL